jgi:uncharacterized membrane protein YgdD (TMEM256/DUF423 family)
LTLQTKRRFARRLLTLLLVLALLLPVGLPAANAASTAPATTAAAPEPVPTAATTALFHALWDVFWGNFVFLSYMYAPREGYFYTEKVPFQAVFGFNALYDDFAFLANCYIDTIRCKFRYDNRDWMVQLWKGAYGVFLFTGGEMGIYNKPLDRGVEHYDSAKQADWIGMEMTIYREGEPVFSRPMENCWWLTGFGWGTLPGFLQSPRSACVLAGGLQFPTAEMAALFAGELAALGFARQKAVSTATPDAYAIEGDTVRLVWQNIIC